MPSISSCRGARRSSTRSSRAIGGSRRRCCATRATHADEFPFPRVHVQPQPETRRAADWWIAASIERATGRSPWRRGVDAALARIAPFGGACAFRSDRLRDDSGHASGGIPLVTSLYGVDAAVLPYPAALARTVRAPVPRRRPVPGRRARDAQEGDRGRRAAGSDAHPSDRARPDEVSALVAGRDRRPCCSSAASSRRRDCSTRLRRSAGLARPLPQARMTIVGGGGDEDEARALVRHRSGLTAASSSSACSRMPT